VMLHTMLLNAESLHPHIITLPGLTMS